MKRKNLLIQIPIVVAILIVLNLISDVLYFRLDFTEDNRYTLSGATKEILADLKDVITVKAYFTEELPAQLAYVRRDLMDQLIEYEDLSGGNLVFEFINPNESEALKEEAIQKGVAPVSINVVENDQRQQIQAYMGLVFQSGDRTEVIPLVQPGAAMEYDLSTSIKKLAISNKPKVGLIQGYGEPSFRALPQLAEQLSVLYDLDEINLSDSAAIPGQFKSLIWVSPVDTLSPVDLAKLDRYLERGGNLFLAYANVRGDFQTSLLSPADDIGLTGWLRQKGLVMGTQFVVDAQCAPVNVQQRTGMYTLNSQINFPFFPQVNQFAEHPITSGLEGILLPFVNPLVISSPDTSLTVRPLAFSTEMSGLVQGPLYIDIKKRWSEQDFSAPGQILAATVEGIGAGNGKLVVIANGQFVVNGEGQQAQAVNPDNINFASNAVDWLSDDTGLIELRTKGVTHRPLETIEDSTRNLLK
ncbi:MAG: GldG family protein, partial [Cyclobacteriaceae bacterium]|nr:GldG family protein [Cyclobacteriaceae bacterium]